MALVLSSAGPRGCAHIGVLSVLEEAAVAARAFGAVPGVISPVGMQDTDYGDGHKSLPPAARAARRSGARLPQSLARPQSRGLAAQALAPQELR